MPRKISQNARHAPANDASAPATKRARKLAAPRLVAPPVKPAIDLGSPSARKQIIAAWPREVPGKRAIATPEAELAAPAYDAARDAEARAVGAKDASGNVLAYAMGDAEEMTAGGFRVTFKAELAAINYAAAIASLIESGRVSREELEPFRGADKRVLRVVESKT